MLQTAILYTAALVTWACAFALYVCFLLAVGRLAQRYR